MTALHIITAAAIATVLTWWLFVVLPRHKAETRALRTQGRCVSCDAELPKGNPFDDCDECWWGRQ